MRHAKIAALLLGIAAIASPAFAVSQNVVPNAPINVGGVGPAVAGSVQAGTLPEAALTFVVEYYPAAGIVECEKNYLQNTYEIELSDGTDLEFDKAGNLIEIDSSDNNVLSDTVIQAVLPAQAYNQLKTKNATGMVESIEHNKEGYKVELNDQADTKYYFADNGQFIRQKTDK